MDRSGEQSGHTPVLPREVCDLLAPGAGEVVVDATVGLGGHSLLLADAIGESGTLIGLDVDPRNLDVARERLSGVSSRLELVHANFSELGDVLSNLGIGKVDLILADLGVSSTQLDEADRGFSFQREGPLDMRMDPRLELTAADIVNGWKETQLSDIFYYNAQEFLSRKIAKGILMARRDRRIATTADLSEVVCKSVGVNDPTSRRSKIHPATRVFQALRMTVNREMENLEALLQASPGMLAPGGRIGVISFHSVEDKAVKLDFRERKKSGEYEVVTKKPVTAADDERRSNPRSRSAKLRVARRVTE